MSLPAISDPRPEDWSGAFAVDREAEQGDGGDLVVELRGREGVYVQARAPSSVPAIGLSLARRAAVWEEPSMKQGV